MVESNAASKSGRIVAPVIQWNVFLNDHGPARYFVDKDIRSITKCYVTRHAVCRIPIRTRRSNRPFRIASLSRRADFLSTSRIWWSKRRAATYRGGLALFWTHDPALSERLFSLHSFCELRLKVFVVGRIIHPIWSWRTFLHQSWRHASWESMQRIDSQPIINRLFVMNGIIRQIQTLL